MWCKSFFMFYRAWWWLYKSKPGRQIHFNKAKKSVLCDRFFCEELKHIPCIHTPTRMFYIKIGKTKEIVAELEWRGLWFSWFNYCLTLRFGCWVIFWGYLTVWATTWPTFPLRILMLIVCVTKEVKLVFCIMWLNNGLGCGHNTIEIHM
jgi:hypothetical protein